MDMNTLYDLVINYYIKGYGIGYNSHESNPRDDEFVKLHLYEGTGAYYIDWDNISDSYSKAFWDNTLLVSRYLT